jgi:hypothetical protein
VSRTHAFLGNLVRRTDKVYGQAHFSGFRKEPKLVRIWNTRTHDDNYLTVNISSAQKLLPPTPGKEIPSYSLFGSLFDIGSIFDLTVDLLRTILTPIASHRR